MELKASYEELFENKTGLTFNNYYNKFFKKLTYYVKKFGVNELDAEGLANDAFMKALDKIEMYDSKYEFGPWLFKIAKNLTLKHINDNKSTILVDYNQEQDDDFDSSYNALKYHISKKQDDYTAELTNEKLLEYKYSETLKEIHKLGPKYKNILILSDIDGKSYKEIAELTNLPLQTIKNRLHHGRGKLEKVLLPKFNKAYEN